MGEHKTIYEIFGDVKREVGPVGKGSRNTQQNFNFRGVDAVVNAAAGALDKHGVITTPHLDDVVYTTVETGQKRTLMAHVRVKVTYRFAGPGGDSFEATVPGEAMDSGDKGTAKAMSVAYRICLIQALNLPTGDPDPDSQTYERSPSMSAGSAFDAAGPGRPDQNGQQWKPRQGAANAEAPPAPKDGAWLDGALAKAGNLPTADQCRALWRESAAKVNSGELAKTDAQRVQDILRARIEDLGREAKMRGAATLADDDPWAAKIEALASAEEAGGALAEVERLLGGGHMNEARAGQVRDAIIAAFPQAGPEAQAAA